MSFLTTRDRALAFMYPSTCDTEYFGGIEIIMCT